MNTASGCGPTALSDRTLPLPQWRGRVEEGPYILHTTEYEYPAKSASQKADGGVFHGKIFPKKSPAFEGRGL